MAANHQTAASPPTPILNRIGQRTFLFLYQQLTIVYFWAILSILGGSLGLVLAKQSSFYYFWMMHLTWGVINLTCWAAIRFHIRHRQTLKASTEQVQKIHHHVLKMLLINVFFDALYVGVGICLTSLDFIPVVLRLPFQSAVIIQGAVLLVLDAFFSWRHWQYGKSV